tara:strand:- start:19 stop:249 length:231 start_codon:yes stop_codon:yes gene_type:complete
MADITNIKPVNKVLIETLETLLKLANEGAIETSFLLVESKDNVYTFLDGRVSSFTLGEVEKLKAILLAELLDVENY